MTKWNRSLWLICFSLPCFFAAAAAALAQTEDLRVIYQKPDVDLRSYRQILVMPLVLTDTRLVPPPWVENPNPKLWSLSRDNQEFLRTAFSRSIRAGIEESGEFTVTTASAPGTLQLEVRLVSLTPWAARNEAVETLGSGTLTFEAHVRDAQTADLLAVFEGTQQVGKEYQENTDLNKAANLEDHFTEWGRNVSRRLAARQRQ